MFALLACAAMFALLACAAMFPLLACAAMFPLLACAASPSHHHSAVDPQRRLGCRRVRRVAVRHVKGGRGRATAGIRARIGQRRGNRGSDPLTPKISVI
jgi:hypothetical protein